ncbi:MAG: nucleotide exchange factor GrpE [Pyrinomonadaceae bacterium]
MFKKRKMSANDQINEENQGEEVKIPVSDRRRVTEDGVRTDAASTSSDEPKTDQAGPSRREAELEQKLKAETERREAAEAKLVGVQAKFEEAKSALERETAEMRERLKKTLDAQAKQSQFNFLTTLLPVLDNLNRAIEASEKDPSLDHLREGVIGTARSFEQALMSVGVEAVPSVGEEFNPELHEALDMLPVDSPDQDGRITAEYSRGYKLGDRLLRPARVQVAKSLAQSAGE